MRALTTLPLLALLLTLTACGGGDDEDSGTDTETADSGDDGDDTSTDTDTDTTSGEAEVRFVLGYLNQDISDVELTLDGNDMLADVGDAIDSHEGYFFLAGRDDPGVSISAGSHEVTYRYAFEQPVCLNPPECTNVEYQENDVSGTVSFDAVEGDTVVVAAIISFAFTGQEIVAEHFSWSKTVAPPATENRGVFVMQGGSSGINGPLDVRVVGNGASGPENVQEFIGFQDRKMISVPFADQVQLAVAPSGQTNYATYEYGVVGDGQVRYAVVRAANQGPFIPLQTGAGAQRLQALE